MIKKSILVLSLFLLCAVSFAQDQDGARKLVDEGIALHDKRDFASAIQQYDKALQLDKDNLLALAEKSLTLLAQQKHQEVIDLATYTLRKHKDGAPLRIIYISYGNALDILGRGEESVKVYDLAIKKFPDVQMLYFNKAVTLYGLKRYDEARIDIQKSLQLNPQHPGSHNGSGFISTALNNPIAAILSYARFLTIEPTGQRAAEISTKLQALLNANVSQAADKTVNITFDVGNSTKGKPVENSFTSTKLVLSLTSAMDYSDQFKNETPVQKMMRKFDAICSSLKETKANNHGFYWDYYVPYFVEMKEKGFIETFANIALITNKDLNTRDWLGANEEKLKAFSQWSKNFKWQTRN